MEDEITPGRRAHNGLRLENIAQHMLDRQPIQVDEIGRGPMQHPHVVAAPDQGRNNLRADKTGAARDEDFHSGFS
jgi:hypothetical protein